MMTNFEWLKEKISKMTQEEYMDTYNHPAPWCESTTATECTYDCELCATNWFSKEYIEPMPHLEVGMMVHVKYSDGEVAGLGIVRTWNNNLIVTYEDGGFDPVDDEDVIIDAIYKAPSFGYIDSTNLAIWSRD